MPVRHVIATYFWAGDCEEDELCGESSAFKSYSIYSAKSVFISDLGQHFPLSPVQFVVDIIAAGEFPQTDKQVHFSNAGELVR